MPPRALPGDLDFWMLHFQFSHTIHHLGDVAQMVERSLSMWEVGGSIPPVSKCFCLSWAPFLGSAFHFLNYVSAVFPNIKSEWWTTKQTKLIASSGNRTRAARVAGEHSTTEPTMLSCCFHFRVFTLVYLYLAYMETSCLQVWFLGGILISNLLWGVQSNALLAL